MAADRIGIVREAVARASREGSASRIGGVCLAATEVLALNGAGLSLMIDGELGGVAGVCDPVVAAVQELELGLGEGPCVDAWAQRRPILESDLGAPRGGRWPRFAPAGVRAGVRAVFAFPLHLREIRIGVFVCYRDHAGALSAQELADGLLLAAMGTETIIGLQSEAPPGILHKSLASEPPHWAEIHQATGVVCAQLEISLEEAFARLRAYAVGNGHPLGDVAQDVLAHRLRLERAA